MCRPPPEPDDIPYGDALAEAVADRLAVKPEVGEVPGVVNNHRDYCGMGLDYAPVGTRDFDGLTGALGEPSAVSQYRYGHVHDGNIDKAKIGFPERSAFVAWLARQSDRSLFGLDEDEWSRGNQRLTRERLEEFVARPPYRR